MCKFLSVLLTRQEELIWHPGTDSHEDLINLSGFSDNGSEHFIRLEYYPTSNDPTDFWDYRLIVDELYRPKWFTDDVRERVVSRLNNIISGILIKEDQSIVYGKTILLLDNVCIRRAINCRIISMMKGSFIEICESSYVHRMEKTSSIDRLVCNSFVDIMAGKSSINQTLDYSIVNSMWESSRIDEMRGSSRVRKMCDDSFIKSMTKDTVVDRMHMRAVVASMNMNSYVSNLYDKSSIDSMLDESMVGCMYDNSEIKSMRNNSCVNIMYGGSRVNIMNDSSRVNHIYSDTKIKKVSENWIHPASFKSVVVDYQAKD